ncbi:hypothetical protein LTR84_001109 [Exophiala bonariae]|uniref:Aminoglycoside phosphotransferase domain-containing protein n=1 Tax=Exophiala bonariae TaxID=1690606 RepID=A0AAV9NSG7_9EURO|nr:hypothetical protein LTR84_001109 [Exophiala bonariae]
MPTPRSNPNYKVYFSDVKIKSIVAKSLDDVDPDEITIDQLPSGKSFNNRIYYVDIHTKLRSGEESLVCSDASDTGEDEPLERITSRRTPATTSYALKVIGRGFDARKIQNEIASLLLLEKYCPSMNVPRVLSWSEDGMRVQTRSDPEGSVSLEEHDHLPIEALRNVTISDQDKDLDMKQGWMLLSRVPGRIIYTEDLEGDQGTALMMQIAAYVAEWRKTMPRGKAVGNMILIPQAKAAPPAATLYARSILPGTDVYIYGRLTGHVQPSQPLTTHLEYVTHRLKSALRKLEDSEIYDYIRKPMTDLVHKFMRDTLPQLDIAVPPEKRRMADCSKAFPDQAETGEKMMFTHYDLSPRNVLVTEDDDGKLNVSAILDLEFSGMYPIYEEFANTLVNDAYDWPKHSYETFIAALRALEALPAALGHAGFCCKGVEGDRDYLGELQRDEVLPFGDLIFHQVCLVMRVIENVAPWWLKTSCNLTVNELQKELDGAYARVERAIKSLEAMCTTVHCGEEDMEKPT